MLFEANMAGAARPADSEHQRRVEPLFAVEAAPDQTGTAVIQLGVKRALDVVSSLVLLVFLFPVLLLIAVAIRLVDRGPALYVQERSGRDMRDVSAFSNSAP